MATKYQKITSTQYSNAKALSRRYGFADPDVERFIILGGRIRSAYVDLQTWINNCAEHDVDLNEAFGALGIDPEA